MVAMWMVERERHVASLETPYGWIITRDRSYEIQQARIAAGEKSYNSDPSQVGQMGPSSVPDDIAEALRAGEGVEFRLLDQGDLDAYGDGNETGTVRKDHPDFGVVYEGRLIDPSGVWSDGPLNDFGAYIANGIQYRNAAGEWEYL